jgi:Flp pilus assembly protein TadG
MNIRNRNKMMKSRKKQDRRGVALVEFAIVAPILFMFFFACIEFSRVNMIRNAIVDAAYEGARSAITPGATAADGISKANSILAYTKINGATVTCNPSTILSTTSTVSITISVNASNNLWFAPFYAKNMTMTKTCTLTKEKITGG